MSRPGAGWLHLPSRATQHAEGHAPRGGRSASRRRPSHLKLALGLALAGLFALAAPTFGAVGWNSPQATVSGELTRPSMVGDNANVEYVVARGDTGLWYITNKSGDWVRTRLTQDHITTANGQAIDHFANGQVIAINAAGTLTIVYEVFASPIDSAGGCDSLGLRYIVRSGSSWTAPKRIPDSTCQHPSGLVVRGAKMYLATNHSAGNGAGQVSYFTNASGAWTHVMVANGFATDSPISLAGLTTYDGKPMLAYITRGRLMYARGQTSTGNFVYEKAASTSADSQPSVDINPQSDWPMIVWAAANGTHYAYRNAGGWHSSLIMPGNVRAILQIDTSGRPHVATADGDGGLWYTDKPGSAWQPVKLDTHTVSDLGGLALGPAAIHISYIRGLAHLYVDYSNMGC